MYAILSENGNLIISNGELNRKNHLFKNYGKFKDEDKPWKDDTKKLQK